MDQSDKALPKKRTSSEELPSDLQSIYKSVNRSGVHRCSICNCVNNESIETNLGDYRSHMSFVNDPKDQMHFICVTCEESIQSLRDDYQYMDEWLEEEENED